MSKLSCELLSRYIPPGYVQRHDVPFASCVMTSSNGNIFRVTDLLWGESIGLCWILLTKASDAELWCFLWSAHEQTFKQQKIETLVIWDAIVLIMTSLWWKTALRVSYWSLWYQRTPLTTKFGIISTNAVLYLTLHYIEPRYNGTPLY